MISRAKFATSECVTTSGLWQSGEEWGAPLWQDQKEADHAMEASVQSQATPPHLPAEDNNMTFLISDLVSFSLH